MALMARGRVLCVVALLAGLISLAAARQTAADDIVFGRQEGAMLPPV